MSIIEEMKKEIENETLILENYRNAAELATNTILYCKKPKNRSRQYFYRVMGEKKVRYIKRGDWNLILKVTRDAFNSRVCAVLVHDIEILSRMIDGFIPYDPDSIIAGMPDAYKEALDEYGDTAAVPVSMDKKDIRPETPSENTVRMRNKYPVSNGLIVRSKSEALIAEYLLAAGIVFRYEQALNLVNTTWDDAGFEYAATERVYPDFTIYLPDGSVIIWEHEGMMDSEEYQKRNLKKMMLYFRNGYYIPKNLIITMESSGKPLDTDAIRRIIDGFIKPLYQ